MKKYLFIILLIILDFVTKRIVFNYLNLNSFITITSILDLTHIHNYGILFGFFSGIIPPWLIVMIGSIITVIVIYLMTKASSVIEEWGLVLIIAGALSNIFDRAINNYVLDFIWLHYDEFYWPAFNLADIYITIGVLIILYQAIRNYKNKITK